MSLQFTSVLSPGAGGQEHVEANDAVRGEGEGTSTCTVYMSMDACMH